MLRVWIAVVGLAGLALAATAMAQEEPIPSDRFMVDTAHPVVQDTVEGPVMPEPQPYDPLLRPMVDLAAQDLSTQFGFLPTDIEVLEAQFVVWPDRGLGCPAEGMIYIQVPVDGTLIRLKVNDVVYEYHSGARRLPFLCKNTGKEISPPTSPSETPLPPPGFGV